MVYLKNEGATRIRKAIDYGYVTNEEISKTIGTLEDRLGSDTKIKLHDEVADASRYYTFDQSPNFIGRLYRASKDIADKVVTGTAMVGGAAVGAQYQAAKAFAGTILQGKLTGSWDHLLYWLGKKTIEVSGPDMMNAVYQMASATPQVVIGMGVGALAGYLGYKAAKYGIGKVYSSWRKNVTSRKIAAKYQLDSAQVLPAPITQIATPSPVVSAAADPGNAKKADHNPASNFLPFK